MGAHRVIKGGMQQTAPISGNYTITALSATDSANLNFGNLQ